MIKRMGEESVATKFWKLQSRRNSNKGYLKHKKMKPKSQIGPTV